MPGIDSFTKLCLHCDGADASTTFTDSSAGAHTVTPAGNAQIDTAQSKFGGASALSDGDGDALQLPAHSDFALGTGDFVIDFWLRLSSSPQLGKGICDWRPNANGAYPAVFTTTGTGALRYFANSADRITGTTVLAAATWYHVALVRSSGTTRLFLNGVQEGSNYTDATDYLVGATGPALAARNTSYTSGFIGWSDEWRISKGTDRGWSGGFTPPAAAYSAAVPRSQAVIMG